jgi:hypothetical protein
MGGCANPMKDSSFSERSTIKSAFLIPFLVGLIFTLLWQYDNYVYVFKGPALAGPAFPMSLVVILVCCLSALYFLFRRKFINAFSVIAALVVVMLLLVSPVGRAIMTETKLYVFKSQSHTECIASAIEWENGKKLGLCEKIDHGASGYTDAYLYDSSDEITKPAGERAPHWRDLAKGFVSDFGGDGQFITITPMGNHLYFVRVDVSSAEGAHFF